MVLAIGLLVDDAIVVVENVERVMSEEGLSPREATRKSMGQITGALVGVALVLAAVFVPMAFFGGSTGAIYRQFSVTIVSAMTLSVLVAMILTPALCATLLKPIRGQGRALATTGFFGWFNRAFDRGNRRYQGIVHHMLGRAGATWRATRCWWSSWASSSARSRPASCPRRTRARCSRWCSCPPAPRRRKTLEVLQQVDHHFLVEQKDAVDSVFSVDGFSFAGSGQNAGFAFVKLKPWGERVRPELKAAAVANRAMATLVEDPQCHGLRDRAAGGVGARQRQRLRPDAAGPGRPRPRGADAGAQPAARRAVQGTRPGGGAAQRHGGHAGVPARHRPTRRSARSACR